MVISKNTFFVTKASSLAAKEQAKIEQITAKNKVDDILEKEWTKRVQFKMGSSSRTNQVHGNIGEPMKCRQVKFSLSCVRALFGFGLSPSPLRKFWADKNY